MKNILSMNSNIFEVREDNVPVDPKKYLSNDYVDVSDNNTTS